MDASLSAVPPPDGSALCTRCGLCCDGLFDRLPITSDEVALAHRGGSAVERSGDDLLVNLPCSFLQDAVCTVYPERYATCRTFRCKLLRAFTKGRIDADAAAMHVREMRRHVYVMRAATAAVGWTRPDRDPVKRAAQWNARADKVARQALARAELTVVAYNFYADRHFRDGPDPAGPR